MTNFDCDAVLRYYCASSILRLWSETSGDERWTFFGSDVLVGTGLLIDHALLTILRSRRDTGTHSKPWGQCMHLIKRSPLDDGCEKYAPVH